MQIKGLLRQPFVEVAAGIIAGDAVLFGDASDPALGDGGKLVVGRDAGLKPLDGVGSEALKFDEPGFPLFLEPVPDRIVPIHDPGHLPADLGLVPLLTVVAVADVRPEGHVEKYALKGVCGQLRQLLFDKLPVFRRIGQHSRSARC